MNLYHFCAAHMKDSILRTGLTLGCLPMLSEGGVVLHPNVQWLTAEPDPQKQIWATRNLVPYSRTDYRLTVRIPDNYRKKLVRATDYVKALPEEARGLVLDWPGSEKWYVYLGRIPAKWIMGCRHFKGENR